MQEKNSSADIFSLRLKKAIKASGLKQKELAKRIGVSEITMSRYCAGTQKPTHGNLALLATALNVPISSLIDKDSFPITPNPEFSPTPSDDNDTDASPLTQQWKNRALAAEQKLQHIENIIHELFTFAKIK